VILRSMRAASSIISLGFDWMVNWSSTAAIQFISSRVSISCSAVRRSWGDVERAVRASAAEYFGVICEIFCFIFVLMQ